MKFVCSTLLIDICNTNFPVTWNGEQTRANVELVSLAMALNDEKQILFFRTENLKKIEVSYMTIEDTLTMHYPIEERNSKQLGNDDTSRRSRLMYKVPEAL